MADVHQAHQLSVHSQDAADDGGMLTVLLVLGSV